MARTPDPATDRDLWSRRRLLGAGGFAAVALASGCSLSSPTIDGPTRSPASSAPSGSTAPTTTPRPSAPTSAKAASAELGLADLAAAVAELKGTSREDRARLTFLRAAHTEHARALASADPTARPTTAPSIPAAKISISGLDRRAALDRLGRAEAAAAGRHRRAALGSQGLTALLWGSMAAAAESFADVSDGPLPYVGLRPHRAVVLLSDVEANQEMVRQLHAIIWGYQLAIGKLPVLSKRRPRALTGLLQHRVLRDRLIAALVKGKAEVPVAEAAYVPSVDPTNTSTATRLIRSMETALLPFCGLWLAAAGSDTDRELALATLRSTGRTARRWGAGVRGWPGYAD